MEINIMNDQKKQKKKAERCRIFYLPKLDKKATNYISEETYRAKAKKKNVNKMRFLKESKPPSPLYR